MPPLLFRFTALALLLSLAPASARAATPPPAAAWEKFPPHPRLFANAEKWQALKTQVTTDPVSQRMFALIRERAENVLALPSLNLPSKGINLHGPMRQMQGRIAGLAMTYKLTGDARFLTRARQEMKELAETPHWRPGHFLSCSEATTAMALGLDWLYAELTPAERDACARAIIEKGLNESLAAEEKKESWVTSGGNWGPVCHGGMALGALAIAEREPALARRIVERSIASVSYAAVKYAPAGAHSEGPGYWAYGTNFYFLLADALRTTFGTLCDLEKPPGLLKTGDYNIQMTAPSGNMFCYGDSVPEFGFEPVMFWFARELRGYYLAAPTLDRLEPMRAILTSDGQMPDASRLQPIALIWWDPALQPEPGKIVGPLTWWSEGGPQPQAVMRSAWGDPRATYVGIKGGKAAGGHGHMDAGSFILEANGIRWAVDLGRDSYAGPRRNGLADDLFREHQDSKRWTIFNDSADGHSILRFNGAFPWVDGKAEIRPATHTAIPAGYVVDLTPVYEGQVKTAQRGFSLRADRSVVIRDEWTTGDRAALVAAQWMTFAKVTLEKGAAVLTQDGETLRLRVVSPVGAHLAVEDVSKATNPWDSPRPGLSRLTIRVSTPAKTAGHLVLVAEPAVPAGGAASADPILTLPLATW
jgi:oligo-alginate lyase